MNSKQNAMEQIGTLIQASRKPTTTQQGLARNECNTAVAAFKTSYPSPSDVQRAYNPVHWGYTANNPQKAYQAACPTLMEYDSAYGHGEAANWIDIQVSALFGASSKADKTLADSIGIFANTFAAEVRTYKLSELMLFFARYKAGVYDNSYATFDTRRIGNAFFKEFLPQRAQELAAIERDRATEAYLKSRELPEGYTVPEDYNPYTWYQERVRLGEIKSYGNLSKL